VKVSVEEGYIGGRKKGLLKSVGGPGNTPQGRKITSGRKTDELLGGRRVVVGGGKERNLN